MRAPPYIGRHAPWLQEGPPPRRHHQTTAADDGPDEEAEQGGDDGGPDEEAEKGDYDIDAEGKMGVPDAVAKAAVPEDEKGSEGGADAVAAAVFTSNSPSTEAADTEGREGVADVVAEAADIDDAGGEGREGLMQTQRRPMRPVEQKPPSRQLRLWRMGPTQRVVRELLM